MALPGTQRQNFSILLHSHSARGTSSKENTLTDLKSWRVRYTPEPAWHGRSVGTHAGFLKAWTHAGFNDRVLARLKAVEEAQPAGSPPLRIWVTGRLGCRGGQIDRHMKTRVPTLFNNMCQVFQAAPVRPCAPAGHSLGGALAVLASQQISRAHPRSRQTVYTFGCPRVRVARFMGAAELPIRCLKQGQ